MSDTPTPAEIAAKHRYRDQDHSTIAGTAYCWCGWSTRIVNTHKTAITLWSEHVIAALAEHYHLLPKAEPTDTYDHCREEPMVGWEIEQGPHFVRVLDDEVQLEYDGEPEEPISPEAARYFASALASAADVAEEQR
ncbi:hypothetical protein SEA_LUTUM_80 [Gordonia phage Lutum]|uniref:Uncharacterized protein n=1 Tax=Gordonia phage Lutum TaxID=2572527 RepID=A0A4D6T9H9_9CAUD|nr:hypothetical protein SEA_LUTUM_80 [Gordonia phage Lutum]